ncbi:MAG: Gfo/Idh/MocA family oxidoreductase [Bacteroidetes bacterium]|nr:Gfo/Idh/MocA family oxidoreductase [Bacteroidota bacterium]
MDKIRIGIIGCGLASTWHLDYLNTDKRVEVVALTDVNRDNVAAALKRLPADKRAGVEQYEDYNDMLKKSKLDAAFVLTPHKYHYDQVKASLEHGLHVLVEKPLTVSAAESEELVKLADKVKRVLIVAYQYPGRGAVKYVHNAVKSGALGNILYFNAMLGLHWHKLAMGWRRDPKISEGGVLVDSGSHLVDLVLHLTGITVKEVFAFADNDGQNVDVFNSALIRFGEGRTGILSAVGGGPFLLDITIIGDKGAITMRDLETVTHVDEKDFIGEIGTYHQHNKYTADKMPRETLPAEEFVDAVASGNLSASNGKRAVRVAKFTDAAYKSLQTKNPVIITE